MHWPKYLLQCFLLIHMTSHYVGSTDETYAETEAASNGEVSTLELPRPLMGYRKQRVQETFTLQLMPPSEQLEDEVDQFVDLKYSPRSTRSRRRTMMDIALEASAREGLHAMTEFYGRIEPEIIRNGQLLAENHPAALLSKFSAPVDETGDSEMAAYAAITATKAFKKNYKHLNELARQAHTPKISLRRTALEGLCPPRDAPTCMPASERYRTHDGTCNNKRRLRWGAAHMPFNRFLPPDYGDGVDTIRNSVDNVPLSSSRFVSLLVHGAKDGDAPLTLMTAQWGQLLDHDMTSTAQPRSINGSVPSCCGGKDFHPSCFPIKVPLDDPWLAPLKVRCLEFLRSAPAQRRDCVLSWREQTNQATSYIDASPIYSSSTKSSDNARVFRNGLLVFGRGNPEQDVCQRGAIATQCIRSGDGRSGEQPGLLALHHVWVGEHNRIAMELSELNLHWSDEKLYQETRRIIGAMFQHITYREFLPIILGREVCKLFELELQSVGYYEGYDAKTNPTVANSFAAAAFRFGHSLIQNTYMRCDRHHNSINNNVSLHEEFQRGDIGSAGSLHRLLRGLATQRALRRDEFITPELTNHLFQTPGFPFGLDLAAINIQRGRDHGIAPYTAWRVPCGLTPINTWDDFANIVGPESAKRIGHAYRSVHDIDLFVGGISERPVVGGLVGPTFACIIAQQFSNSRKGDRFWYENSGFESSFTPAQLHSIRRVSLAQVLCRAVGGGTFQPHIFIPHTFGGNQRLPCGVGPLTPIDLAPWLEQDPFAAPLHHPTFDANIPDKVFDIVPNDMNHVPSAHLIKEDKTSTNNKINLAHTPLLQTPLSPMKFQRPQNVSKINDKLDFKRKGSTKRPTPRPITGINNKLDKGPKINLSVNRHKRPQTTTRRTVIINNIPIELRTEPNIDPTTSDKNATKTSSNTKKKNTFKTDNHFKARIDINVETPPQLTNTTEELQKRNTADNIKKQSPKEAPTKTTDKKQERKTTEDQVTDKHSKYFEVLHNTTEGTANSAKLTIRPNTEKTQGLKPENMTTGHVTLITKTNNLFETRQKINLQTSNTHSKTAQMLNKYFSEIENKEHEFVKTFKNSTITDEPGQTFTSLKTTPHSRTENDAYKKSHIPIKKFSANNTNKEDSDKPFKNATDSNDSRRSYTGLKTTPHSLITLAKLTSLTDAEDYKKPQVAIKNLTVTDTKNADLIKPIQNPKLETDLRRRYTGLKTTTELPISTPTKTVAKEKFQTSLKNMTKSSFFTTELLNTSMRRHTALNMNQNKQLTEDTDIDPIMHSTSENLRRVQRNFDYPQTDKELGSERNIKFSVSNTTNQPFKLVTAFNLHTLKNRTLKHTTKLPKITKTAKTTPENLEIRQYQTRPIYTRPQKVIVDGPQSEQYEIEINIRQTNKSPVMRPTASYADYTTSYRPHNYDRYTNYADYTSTTPAYGYYAQAPTTAANLVQLQRTRPPTVIYLDEHDDRTTTKVPSLLQNFLSFATSGFGGNRNPVNQKEKPIFSQNNVANMGLAGTLANSPHSSLASSQYLPEPPQPMASSFNQIGGFPGNGAQMPHVASGAVSGGHFGSITGVASTNGADSTFSFNIRPRPPAVNTVNVGSANPTGASYGQYGLIPTRRPTYAQASRPDFNNLPIAAYALEQYNKLPNRESLSPFSTGHKIPQQQSYFRTQNEPQLKIPTVNRNDVPNPTDHKIDMNDYDYLSRTLETITENDEDKHIDESVEYEYNDDLESDEISKKFDRDGYIRPEHMIASLLKNQDTGTSNITNVNKTATLDDNFVLPVLNSSKQIFTDIPVPIKLQKELKNLTDTTTGLTDALAKHLHNDILAEDYDEDASDAFIVSKTAALTAMTGTQTKNRLQKVSFAPINILTKPERPDNWVIYETPEEKPLLPELPEINVDTFSAAEVPMPFADLTNIWLTKYRNKLVRERDSKNNSTVQLDNMPMTKTYKNRTETSAEISFTDLIRDKKFTTTDSTLMTIMTGDIQTDGGTSTRRSVDASVNGTTESEPELKIMPDITRNVTNITVSSVKN